MHLRRHAPPTPALLARVVALVAAAMVMVLSLSTVSPELHAWLHDKTKAQGHTHACSHHAGHATGGHASHAPSSDSDKSDTHQCAVTMFSHGVVHQAAALLTQPCEGILRAVNYRAFERLALAQPRYLHLPPQAPPAV